MGRTNGRYGVKEEWMEVEGKGEKKLRCWKEEKMKRGKKREKEEQNKLSSRFMRDIVCVSQKTSVKTSSRGAGGIAELIIRFRCFSRRKVSRYRRAVRAKFKKESPPSMAARELSYLPSAAQIRGSR